MSSDPCAKFQTCTDCLVDPACTFCDTSSPIEEKCYDATSRPQHCSVTTGTPITRSANCPAQATSGGVGSVVGVILGIGVILTGVAIAVGWGYRRYQRNKKQKENDAALGGEGGLNGAGNGQGFTGANGNGNGGNQAAMVGGAGVGLGSVFLGADEQKHHGFSCRKCGMKPVRGIRFSCSTCDFDLCQACFLRFSASHGDPAKVAHTFMKFERAFSPQDRSISDLNYTALRKVLDALAHPRVTSLLDFLPLNNFQWQASSRSVATATAHVDLHLPNRISTLSVEEDTYEYNRIVDRTERFCLDIHGKQLRVTAVERVDNPVLEFLFNRRRVELHEPGADTSELFHGTSAEALMSIARDGFRLPEASKHGAMFGRGVYFATDATKSERYTHGHNQLLLCEVALGKQLKLLGATRASSALNGSNVLREYDSVHAPRDTKDTKGVLNDEFIVYHPFQAIVRYIVTFDATVKQRDPPEMEAFSDVEACPLCKRKFWIFLFRYNCNLCGQVVCDDCSKHHVQLPEIRGYGDKTYSICDACHDERDKRRRLIGRPKIKTKAPPLAGGGSPAPAPAPSVTSGSGPPTAASPMGGGGGGGPGARSPPPPMAGGGPRPPPPGAARPPSPVPGTAV